MWVADKRLVSTRGQFSPMHTHVIKTEDIINRGGATLMIAPHGSDDATWLA